MPTRWNSPGRWGQESPHRDRCTWRSRRPSPLHIHSPLCRSRPSALAQNECAPRFAVICVAGTYVLCRAGLAGHVVVRGVLLQVKADASHLLLMTRLLNSEGMKPFVMFPMYTGRCVAPASCAASTLAAAGRRRAATLQAPATTRKSGTPHTHRLLLQPSTVYRLRRLPGRRYRLS